MLSSPPASHRACAALATCEVPSDAKFPPVPDPSLECSQEKKTFGEWLLNAAVRDSGAIGAGYENELKDGRFKGGKKK